MVPDALSDLASAFSPNWGVSLTVAGGLHYPVRRLGFSEAVLQPGCDLVGMALSPAPTPYYERQRRWRGGDAPPSGGVWIKTDAHCPEGLRVPGKHIAPQTPLDDGRQFAVSQARCNHTTPFPVLQQAPRLWFVLLHTTTCKASPYPSVK